MFMLIICINHLNNVIVVYAAHFNEVSILKVRLFSVTEEPTDWKAFIWRLISGYTETAPPSEDSLRNKTRSLQDVIQTIQPITAQNVESAAVWILCGNRQPHNRFVERILAQCR